MSWRCRAEWLAPSHPGAQVVTCDAHGERDSDADKHMAATGHPTTVGLREAEKETAS